MIGTFPLENMTIHEALALEEVAFIRVRADGIPIIRSWRTIPRALTIGRFQCSRGEVDLDLANELGIPVVRRMSGGGAVLNDGEGEFAFSVTSPTDLFPGGITGAYSKVLGWVNASLEGLGLDTYVEGSSIYLRDVGKVSGSSMRWTWDTVQVHGTILHSMDSDLMKRLLWGRFGCSDGTPSIRKEVAPVGSLTGLSIEELKSLVINGIFPGIQREESIWSDEESKVSRDYLRDRYGNDGWNLKL